MRRIESHGRGTIPPAARIARQFLGRRISPAIEISLDSSARRAFPLRFRGQPVISASDPVQPFAKSHGIKPRGPNDWLARLLKIGIIPEGRRRAARFAEKMSVLRASHLINAKLKGVHPHTMHRSFIIAAAG